MDGNLHQKSVCPECGQSPVDVGGDVVVYTKRVRRRVLLVWLVLVFLLGALALPWVQVGLADWGWQRGLNVGNPNAIWDQEPYMQSEPGYGALVQPPVRWKDLRLAGEGDREAIELFRRSVQGFGAFYVRDRSVGERAISFQVGFPIEDSLRRSYSIVVDGEEIEYSFSAYGYAVTGWPIPWASYHTNHFYVRGDQWDTADRLLSVEEDLVHSSITTRKIRWSNIVFLVMIAAGICGVGRWICQRACRRCRVSCRRGWIVGLCAAGVFAGVVLVVGSQRRTEYPGDVISGVFEPGLTTDQREWDVDGFFERFESDDEVRLIAQALIEDFGEMTDPNNLVILGVVSDVGEAYFDINFGLNGFRLFSFGSTSFVRFEADGSYALIPVPEDNTVPGFWFGNGYMAVNRGFGQSPETIYGAGVSYRNIIISGVMMYVVWKLMLWVGWRLSSRVQRRRVRRGVCVWCRYPCSE